MDSKKENGGGTEGRRVRKRLRREEVSKRQSGREGGRGRRE